MSRGDFWLEYFRWTDARMDREKEVHFYAWMPAARVVEMFSMSESALEQALEEQWTEYQKHQVMNALRGGRYAQSR